MDSSLLADRGTSKRSRGIAVGLLCFAGMGLFLGSNLAVKRQGVQEFAEAHMPVYRIFAKSPYDAGLQHGKMAQQRIHGWFSSAEMQSIFRWAHGNGSAAFEQLKRDNGREFPHFVEEMQGIAEGAGVSLDQVWCANLINELENLMDIAGTPAEHCSDIYAVADGGYEAGFAHGHNEDWSDMAKKFWYFTAVSYENSTPGFKHCAGMSYPGTLAGWASTWNEHGIFGVQNTLMPRKSRKFGLACAFVQRRAVCSARTLDDVVAGLSVHGWSDGASMNVVDLRGKRMANIEIWEDRHSVMEVTEAMGNYSHFNQYKHLTTESGEAIDDSSVFVGDKRQSTVDALPGARSANDIMDRLSNPNVFRPHATLMTTVLNSTGLLRIWVASPSATSSPMYSWNILSFFDTPAHV